MLHPTVLLACQTDKGPQDRLLLQLCEVSQACQAYSTEAARLQHVEKQQVQQLFDEMADSLSPLLQKAING